MISDHWVDRTRQVLSVPPASEARWEPILTGGSDRKFFRFTAENGARCIVVFYTAEREENDYYAGFAGFLKEIGVSVPDIFQHDEEARVLWLEDIGGEDLYRLRTHPWEDREPYYKLALDEAARLHNGGWEEAMFRKLKFTRCFDRELYRWERDYFFDHCVEQACGIREYNREGIQEELEERADALLEQGGTSLVHRDFQSQNIMLREGKVYLIDFQGMRRGTRFYDLASLLKDPYAAPPAPQEEALLRYYHRQHAAGQDWSQFRQLYLGAALQRLMQALGAYGNLGLNMGKKKFLNYIPSTLQTLRSLGAELKLHADFMDLLERCEKPAQNYAPID